MGFYAKYKYSIWISKDTTGLETDAKLLSLFRWLYDSLWDVWGKDADGESVEAYYRFQEDTDTCRNQDGSYQASIWTNETWQRAGTRINYDVIAKDAKRHGIMYEVAEKTDTALDLWKRRVYGPDGKAWYDECQEYVNGGYEEWTHPEMPGKPTLGEIAADHMSEFLLKRAVATGK